MENYVNSNYIWRVIFTLIIVFMHTGLLKIPGAYIAVDYFFLFSGLMLAKYADQNGNEISTPCYILRRIKRLYPTIIFSFAVYFVMFFCVGCRMSAKECVWQFLCHLSQVVPLMYFVIPGDLGMASLNYQIWYVQVLLVISILVYYMYVEHKKIFGEMLAPLIAIFAWSYMGKLDNGFNTVEYVFGFVEMQYIRGLAGICTGVVLWKVICKKNNYVISVKQGIIYRVIEFFAFSIAIAGMVKYGNNKMDVIFVLFVIIGIYCSFMYPTRYEKFFVRFKKINDFMYPIYINHIFVWYLFNSNETLKYIKDCNRYIAIATYLIILVIYSLLMMKILELIKSTRCKQREGTNC